MNWMVTPHFPLAGNELVQADNVSPPLTTAKSLAFAPLKLSFNASENPDRLVTVAFNVFDVVVRVPYAIEFGVTVAGIVGPVVIATA